jgi:ABC-type transport system involved in cytochrome bd biosynthesis fused ATPase/permease subunit
VTDREREALDAYRELRLRDQLVYYEARRSEFDSALGQLGLVSAVVLAFGATAAALAGASVGGTSVWAVLAAVFPAVSTALAAFGTLLAFEQQAKIYADAAKALRRIDRTPPDVTADPDQAAAVRAYVESAEDVFRREQGQWGQLASELKPPDAA